MKPAGYLSDLVDGARFTIEDPDDVAIAVFTRPQIEESMFERFAQHVGIARQELQKLAEDFHEVIADHNRLVRELDVLLNGEEGAARQASLCDIVGQVQREGIRISRPFGAEPQDYNQLVPNQLTGSTLVTEPPASAAWRNGVACIRSVSTQCTYPNCACAGRKEAA